MEANPSHFRGDDPLGCQRIQEEEGFNYSNPNCCDMVFGLRFGPGPLMITVNCLRGEQQFSHRNVPGFAGWPHTPG